MSSSTAGLVRIHHSNGKLSHLGPIQRALPSNTEQIMHNTHLPVIGRRGWGGGGGGWRRVKGRTHPYPKSCAKGRVSYCIVLY